MAAAAAAQDSATLSELQERWAAIGARLDAAEAAAALFVRLSAIFAQIEAASAAFARLQLQQGPGAAAPAAPAAPSEQQQAASRAAALAAATGPDASAIQRRLAAELADKGFSDFRFVRCPPDYYDRPLEARQAILRAASIDHLCKSIIMENTRAHPSVDGWSNPRNSKYYVVIVQYTARLNAEKLKNALHRMNTGIGKQYFNMRLCPEDVSDTLSGYEHNAVTPIGIATPLPVIMSDAIMSLKPDTFWLGAGEVDLKVGISASEFVQAYQPMVLDCTH